MDRHLLQLIENSQEAILIADRHGKIRYWNLGAEKMFGYSSSEVIGLSLDLIIPENLRARHWEGFFQVMKTGQTKYSADLLRTPGIDKNGRRLSLEFSVVLLKNVENSAIDGCATIMRDVSSRWQKEQELKKRLVDCERQLSSTDKGTQCRKSGLCADSFPVCPPE